MCICCLRPVVLLHVHISLHGVLLEAIKSSAAETAQLLARDPTRRGPKRSPCSVPGRPETEGMKDEPRSPMQVVITMFGIVMPVLSMCFCIYKCGEKEVVQNACQNDQPNEAE